MKLVPRGAFAALLALVLLTPAAPVAAATATPAKVGLVSFVGASLTDAGATLTVAWPAAAAATSYEVFVSTSFAGVPAVTTPAARTTGTRATISGLRPGTDYFVQVRGVSAGHVGPRSNRVGHGTIAAEASGRVGDTERIVSWNVCSVKCGGFATRKKVIDARIKKLTAGIVVLQEASKYTKAPSGYAFAYDGQNDILYRSADFAKVTRGTAVAHGKTVFPRAHAAPGKGVAWAALRDRSSGQYLVVFDVHLVSGSTTALTAQREYEAGRVGPYVDAVYRALAARFGTVTDWSAAPAVLAGDFNTNKSRRGDDTQRILRQAGWYDAYDQARTLAHQHDNTANPARTTKPVVGITWGDHVDKVLVRPARAIVRGWANAGARTARGYYAAPLGSDHHPLLVTVALS